MIRVASALEYFEFTSLHDVTTLRVGGHELTVREGVTIPDLAELPRRMGRDHTARVAAARAARSSLKPGRVAS